MPCHKWTNTNTHRKFDRPATIVQHRCRSSSPPATDRQQRLCHPAMAMLHTTRRLDPLVPPLASLLLSISLVIIFGETLPQAEITPRSPTARDPVPGSPDPVPRSHPEISLRPPFSPPPRGISGRRRRLKPDHQGFGDRSARPAHSVPHVHLLPDRQASRVHPRR